MSPKFSEVYNNILTILSQTSNNESTFIKPRHEKVYFLTAHTLYLCL